MYRCYCCGARFAVPRPYHPWPVRRFTRAYGDAAAAVCPRCGQESFGPAGGYGHGLV